jgi:hypothetical protein
VIDAMAKYLHYKISLIWRLVSFAPEKAPPPMWMSNFELMDKSFVGTWDLLHAVAGIIV